jgi:anhydro-N-acetylmuramic acid kinase
VGRTIPDAVVARTLLELTAQTIVAAIADSGLADYELIVCGGGTKNDAMMARIGELAGRKAMTTGEFGVDPDWVEAAAMAWLARARIELAPGNIPSVTAAREGRVLGGLYCGGSTPTE